MQKTLTSAEDAPVSLTENSFRRVFIIYIHFYKVSLFSNEEDHNKLLFLKDVLKNVVNKSLLVTDSFSSSSFFVLNNWTSETFTDGGTCSGGQRS